MSIFSEKLIKNSSPLNIVDAYYVHGKKTGRKMKIDLNFMQIFATSLVKAVSSWLFFILAHSLSQQNANA